MTPYFQDQFSPPLPYKGQLERWGSVGGKALESLFPSLLLSFSHLSSLIFKENKEINTASPLLPSSPPHNSPKRRLSVGKKGEMMAKRGRPIAAARPSGRLRQWDASFFIFFCRRPPSFLGETRKRCAAAPRRPRHFSASSSADDGGRMWDSVFQMSPRLEIMIKVERRSKWWRSPS